MFFCFCNRLRYRYAAGPYSNGNQSAIDEFYGHTFALSFTSQLNETYTTIPIEVVQKPTITETESALADSIKYALEALPMKICPRVFINLTMGYDAMFDPYKTQVANTQYSRDDFAYIHFTVEFTGLLMGDQKLLTVHHEECEFCTPQLTGMRLLTYMQEYNDPSSTPKTSFVSEKQVRFLGGLKDHFRQGILPVKCVTHIFQFVAMLEQLIINPRMLTTTITSVGDGGSATLTRVCAIASRDSRGKLVRLKRS